MKEWKGSVLDITSCTFEGNTAAAPASGLGHQVAFDGGAVALSNLEGCSVQIENSTFLHNEVIRNRGGAMSVSYSRNSSIHVRNCSFMNNYAGCEGGVCQNIVDVIN